MISKFWHIISGGVFVTSNTTMKYLAFILLLGLFSCSKQEYVTVHYHIEHYGNGELIYEINDFGERVIKDSSFDTTLILPVMDYEYRHEVKYSHYNETLSNIKITIETSTDQKELDREFRGCYTINGILTLIE